MYIYNSNKYTKMHIFFITKNDKIWHKEYIIVDSIVAYLI